MMAILHNKIAIAKAVNVTVLPLEEASRGYSDFDKGVPKKFVLDPHGIVRSRKDASGSRWPADFWWHSRDAMFP
jgi:hypothetical protein